jgi:hypothetical protein
MPTSRDTATDTTASVIGLFSETEPPGFTATEAGSGRTPAGGLTIDCDCCALRNTDACDDCVVSFLLEREPDDAVVIDADEARAMRMLERAGLVPTLRFSTQTG